MSDRNARPKGGFMTVVGAVLTFVMFAFAKVGGIGVGRALVESRAPTPAERQAQFDSARAEAEAKVAKEIEANPRTAFASMGKDPVIRNRSLERSGLAAIRAEFKDAQLIGETYFQSFAEAEYVRMDFDGHLDQQKIHGQYFVMLHDLGSVSVFAIAEPAEAKSLTGVYAKGTKAIFDLVRKNLALPPEKYVDLRGWDRTVEEGVVTLVWRGKELVVVSVVAQTPKEIAEAARKNTATPEYKEFIEAEMRKKGVLH